jgi:hypothetical protein
MACQNFELLHRPAAANRHAGRTDAPSFERSKGLFDDSIFERMERDHGDDATADQPVDGVAEKL